VEVPVGLVHQHLSDPPSQVVRVRYYTPDATGHPFTGHGTCRDIHDSGEAEELAILDRAETLVSVPDTEVAPASLSVIKGAKSGLHEQIQHPVFVL
jgi:hypothetical protein